MLGQGSLAGGHSWAPPNSLRTLPAYVAPQHVAQQYAGVPCLAGVTAGWGLSAHMCGTTSQPQAQTFAGMHTGSGLLLPADLLPYTHRGRAHDVFNVGMEVAPEVAPGAFDARQGQKGHGQQDAAGKAPSAAQYGRLSGNVDAGELDFTTTLGSCSAEPVLVFPRKGTSTEEGVIELSVESIRLVALCEIASKCGRSRLGVLTLLCLRFAGHSFACGRQTRPRSWG
jgi:hypothetical protein